MITKTNTPKFMALRLTGIAMTVAALVVAFSCNQNTQSKPKETLLVDSAKKVVSAGNDGEDIVIITLQSGEVVTYTASNEEERKAMKANIDKHDLSDIQSINVIKGKNKGDVAIEVGKDKNPFFAPDDLPATLVITLKSGEVRTFSTHDKDVDKKLSEVNPNDIKDITVRKK
jgi:hypothetical protein